MDAPPHHAMPSCHKYPNQKATWHCIDCHRDYSDAWSRHKQVQRHTVHICRDCGGRLEAMYKHEGVKNFLRELPRSFVYPFQGPALRFCVTAVFLAFGAGYLGWSAYRRGSFDEGWLLGLGAFLLLLGLGHISEYFYVVIRTTSVGRDNPPLRHTYRGLWPALNPLSQYMMILFLLSIPTIFFLLREMPSYALFAGIVGFFFAPMSVLTHALQPNGMLAINPFQLFFSILRNFVAYLPIVLPLVSVYIGSFLAGWWYGLPMQWLLPSFFAFGAYLAFVEARMLGLLYRTYPSRFPWEPAL